MNDARALNKNLSDIRKTLEALQGGLSTKQFGEFVAIVAQYLQKPQGEKGDVGHTPIKGVDYWTEDDVRILVGKLNEVIHTPQKGEDYFTPEEVDAIVASITLKVENGLLKPQRGTDYMNEEDKLWIEDIVREVTKASQDTDLTQFIVGEGTHKITVAKRAPSSPQEGDLWVDTT